MFPGHFRCRSPGQDVRRNLVSADRPHLDQSRLRAGPKSFRLIAFGGVEGENARKVDKASRARNGRQLLLPQGVCDCVRGCRDSDGAQRPGLHHKRADQRRPVVADRQFVRPIRNVGDGGGAGVAADKDAGDQDIGLQPIPNLRWVGRAKNGQSCAAPARQIEKQPMKSEDRPSVRGEPRAEGWFAIRAERPVERARQIVELGAITGQQHRLAAIAPESSKAQNPAKPRIQQSPESSKAQNSVKPRIQ